VIGSLFLVTLMLLELRKSMKIIAGYFSWNDWLGRFNRVSIRRKKPHDDVDYTISSFWMQCCWKEAGSFTEGRRIGVRDFFFQFKHRYGNNQPFCLDKEWKTYISNELQIFHQLLIQYCNESVRGWIRLNVDARNPTGNITILAHSLPCCM
jgi:hypothetical protein